MFGDMIEFGILDPTKVTRTALQNAASIAGLMITTEAMVAEAPKKDEPAMPAGGGLGSTHWPWIGERTRQVDGAHVALLAEVLNPVACKVGPEIGRDQLLALCERLDRAGRAARRSCPESSSPVRAGWPARSCPGPPGGLRRR